MAHVQGHPWKVTIEEAKKLQKSLSSSIKIRKLPSTINRVAGFDVSYLKKENILIAGMILVDYPSLNFVDSFIVTDQIDFPYIPGYLSFREAPVLLRLINKYKDLAQVFVFDGHGIAHPRGLGIASHIGVLIDRPSIGCAKKKLVGEYIAPENERGAFSDLVYKKSLVGKVLRTKKDVKPVFVSVGNLVNLDEATQFVLNCSSKYRLPEPTRLAHLTVSEYKSIVAKS